MKRIIFLICLFFSFGLVLYQINGQNHEYYQKLYLAKTNRLVYGSSAIRGRILDRNGTVLVNNEGVLAISYHKPLKETSENQIKVATALSPFLDAVSVSEMAKKKYYLVTHNNGKDLITANEYQLLEERKITENELENRKLARITSEDINYSPEEEKIIYLFTIMNEGYNYENKILLTNMTDEEIAKILSLNIPSLQKEVLVKRVYPYEETLKSIFGTVGSIPKEEKDAFLQKGYSLNDIVGVSGLEKEYEDLLKGQKAVYQINSDNTLTLVEEEVPGKDLILNIDINLQKMVEKTLQEEILLAKKRSTSKFFAESYAMVGEPLTGAILALSGQKINADNTFSDVTINALTSSYSMGSVVKGASNTVGYLTGAITVGKKIKDSCVKLYSEPSKCSYTYLGYVDDITALKTSSNYYQFITAIKTTNQNYRYNMKFTVTEDNFKTYRDVFASYGLGSKTEIDYPLEYTGIKGEKIAGDLLLNFAIGQYDTYTPISLLQYINTIATEGTRYALKLKQANYNTFLNQVGLDSSYYKRIKEGMYQVFHGGTASSYVKKDLEAVGKTGTAETFYDQDGDGVVDTSVINSTLAYYFPREEPKYSVVIVAPYITNNGNSSYPFTKKVSLKISAFLSSL